jgi:hypothetical protein
LAGADALAELGAALVFRGPVFVSVHLPLLSEVWGEGLRQQQELDVVAARRNVLLGIFLAIFDDAVARPSALE